ncbi:MAG TPA: hypothetical protein PKA93_00080 [Arachnia sp.]|nr:hypothetical protein [Arachnia sp.]
MRDRIAAGVGIGVWGLGIGVFFTSWTTLVWLTVLVVVSWAVYYAVRPLTLNAALVQYATVLGTLLIALIVFGVLLSGSLASVGAFLHVLILTLFLGTVFFLVWMLPVALIASFLRGGRPTRPVTKDETPTP